MPLRRIYRQLRHRIGYRGTVLLAFGLFDMGYGYSLLAPDAVTAKGPAFQFYDSVADTRFWGVLWLLAGVVLIADAFRKDDRAGYAVGVVIKAGWALGNLVGWFTWPTFDRGWVTASIFGVMSVLFFAEASRAEPYQPDEGEEA